MSTTARLTELRAYRIARSLLELHHAIDGAFLAVGACSVAQLHGLHGEREIVVARLERIAPKVRRNPPLRDAIDAACSAYRRWLSHPEGSELEHRAADDLTVRVIQLRTLLGTAAPTGEEEAGVEVVLAPSRSVPSRA